MAGSLYAFVPASVPCFFVLFSPMFALHDLDSYFNFLSWTCMYVSDFLWFRPWPTLDSEFAAFLINILELILLNLPVSAYYPLFFVLVLAHAWQQHQHSCGGVCVCVFLLMNASPILLFNSSFFSTNSWEKYLAVTLFNFVCHLRNWVDKSADTDTVL